MNDLKDIEDRISKALARIRAAFEADTELEATALSSELAALKEERARDAADLNALISELKPLIGEA
jgi:hypothetical protein